MLLNVCIYNIYKASVIPGSVLQQQSSHLNGHCSRSYISARTAQKMPFLIFVVQLFLWEYDCLWNHYSVMALVYLLISWLLPSIGSACCNIMNKQLWLHWTVLSVDLQLPDQLSSSLLLAIILNPVRKEQAWQACVLKILGRIIFMIERTW